MPGVAGRSGRKPDLGNTKAKNVDRRERAIRAQDNNTEFSPIGGPPQRLTPNGKRLWHRIVKQLDKKNLLTSLDRSLLTEFIEQLELSELAQEAIDKYGIVIENDKGALSKNPAVDVKNNAAKNIKSIGSSLGLDPMSRAALLSTRATPDEEGDDDDILMILKGKKGGDDE